jgi:hypothetical protein
MSITPSNRNDPTRRMPHGYEDAINAFEDWMDERGALVLTAVTGDADDVREAVDRYYFARNADDYDEGMSYAEVVAWIAECEVEYVEAYDDLDVEDQALLPEPVR